MQVLREVSQRVFTGGLHREAGGMETYRRSSCCQREGCLKKSLGHCQSSGAAGAGRPSAVAGAGRPSEVAGAGCPSEAAGAGRPSEEVGGA